MLVEKRGRATYGVQVLRNLNLKQNMVGEIAVLPPEKKGASPRYVVQLDDDRGVPIKNGQRFEMGQHGELVAAAEGTRQCRVVLWPSSTALAPITREMPDSLAGDWGAELKCQTKNYLARFSASKLSPSEYKLTYSDSLNPRKSDEARLLLYEASKEVLKFVFWQTDDRFTAVKNGQGVTLSEGGLTLDVRSDLRHCPGRFYRQ